ncbi:MAG: hypothetical protein RL136_1188 [Planctomycetota bacterium]|jgi:hypothetical protein
MRSHPTAPSRGIHASSRTRRAARALFAALTPFALTVGALGTTGEASRGLATPRPYWIALAPKALPKGGVLPRHTELTDRALLRRARMRSAGGLVDARDLPIDPARVEAILACGADYRTRSRWLNGISVEADAEELARIMRLPFVAGAWPLHATRAEDDPEPAPIDGGIAGGDYGFMDAQLMQIDVPSMHARGFHGEGMVIGILDTGFNRVHEAFHSAEHPIDVIAEWDVINDDANTGIEEGDPANQHNHGTWILGTLAAYRPGEAVGSAYAASFVLAKTEFVPTETAVEEDYYVAGLEFIEAQGADLATSSLGYIDWYTPEQLDGLTAITTQAVNIATANGLVCVTAAGNSGNDADPATQRLIAPADAFDVITCGAVALDGSIAGFSSDGPSADGRVKPEVLANGVSVASVHSTNAGGYQALSGTSLSTPLVAGSIALIMQARAEYGVADVRSALFETAGDFAANGTHDPAFVRGYGVISARAAAMRDRAAEDFNLDGAVDARDLAAVLASWGPCADPDPATGLCVCDLNGDGAVDAADLAQVLARWGM